MSALYIFIVVMILSLCFRWVENAINPNMSKWARVGFRLVVILLFGMGVALYAYVWTYLHFMQ